MLADVVEVCASAGLGGVLAVVDTRAARSVAKRGGAMVVADPGNGEGDMNAAVSVGLAAASARGAATCVVLPADVPRISVADIAGLLTAAGGVPRAVVVAASHDGQGTNALLLRPPDIIPPGFGPPSLSRHIAAGLAAGALTMVRSDLGLAHDVDTPEDLAALQTDHPRPHTARALARLRVNHVLA
jgi:2-phospho-L-lactate guanylyltransferase